MKYFRALPLVITSTGLTDLALAQFPTAQQSNTQVSSEHLTDRPKGVQITVTDFGDYFPSQPRSGTLRYAIETALPGSKIVFSAPGTVELLRPLDIMTPDIIIDGSEVPGVIYGDVIRIRSSNVTLRQLWIFAGDEPSSVKAPGKLGHSKGSDRDTVVVYGPEGEGAEPISNILVEHSWIGLGIDECFSTYGRVSNVTVRDSLIGFGLNRSIHPEDLERAEVPGHSKGVLIGVGASNIRFERNLFIHNFDRNIAVREGVTGLTFLNNVIYNFGRGNTFHVGGKEYQPSSGDFVGNIYFAGSASASDAQIFKALDKVTQTRFNVVGNIGPIPLEQSIEQAQKSNGMSPQLERALKASGALDSWSAFESVLAKSGPHPGLRDRISTLAIKELTERSGMVRDFVTVPHNSEAKVGLGFKPTLANIVDGERLKLYRNNPLDSRAD